MSLPILPRRIEPPTSQQAVQAEISQENQPIPTPSPSSDINTSILPYCVLCTPIQSGETWATQQPTTKEEEENWVSILESNIHMSCLSQAQSRGLLLPIECIDRSSNESSQDFANRCLAKSKEHPVISICDPAKPVIDSLTHLLPKYADQEIPLTANHPFACGVRFFPQLAPPRTLDDLLVCTSKLNTNARLSESSLPLNISSMFPQLAVALKESLPDFTLPGGPCDILAKCNRNKSRISNPKLIICSPGSVLRAEVSLFRSACMLCSQNSQAEFAAVSLDDACKLMEAKKEIQPPDDLTWIPELAFCIRREVKVYCGMLLDPGRIILSSPGALTWGFVRGSNSTHFIRWNFAERSIAAFQYALSAQRRQFQLDSEVDLPDHRDDILLLSFLADLLQQGASLQLPKSLESRFKARISQACNEQTPNEVISGKGVVKDIVPVEEAQKDRCDVCRTELFHQYVFCNECFREGHDPKSLIELQASHPPRPSTKKDRSTLPDWLRVGCRVLVNLTVSGNSNDKPPRVIGASHLPGIILKTGHGFFTLYLEGCGETVVKRKAAIEPHPEGPGLPRGYQVSIKSENEAQHANFLQASAFKTCVYCMNCFTKHHSKRHGPNKGFNVSYEIVNTRNDVLEKLAIDGGDAESISNEQDQLSWASPTETSQKLETDEEEHVASAKLPRTISEEAGRDAMIAAQIMGPSPYHYPSSSATSPPAASTQRLTASTVDPPRDKQPRKTTTRAVSTTTLTTSAARKRTSMEPTMVAPAIKKEESILSASNLNAMFSIPGNNPVKKRLRAQSSPPSITLFGLDEPELAPHELVHSSAVSTALHQGSFFVGGPRSISLLPDRNQDDDSAANKPDEVRDVWARARKDVPLKKVWKFLYNSPQSKPSIPLTKLSEDLNLSS